MVWVVMLVVGAGSFVLRLAPLALFGRVGLSERADRIVRDGGMAAITALIVTSTEQSATGDAMVPTLLAVGLALVLAARGASMRLLLVCGGALYAVAIVAVGLVAP